MDELLVEAIRDNIQKYGYSLDPVDLLQNVKAALVAEGWKSPQDVASIINALTDAFKWNISGEIADARADERTRIVGLFDAADEIDGSLSHIVSAYSGIIEGLREKK
jgi:hypothetical protein